MEIEKVGPDRVVTKEVVTVKDINDNEVQIYTEIKEYSQTRIDAEKVWVAELEAKKAHLDAIQTEMNKEK